MNALSENRPDPESLLRQIRLDDERRRKGRLKIFFGMCAGVGKTYDMLLAAHEAARKGIDVVIGYVETHRRPETEALLDGLQIIPRKNLDYRGTTLQEMDLDAILHRKPRLVLVDELAHTNIPGSRHVKRYQDVLELLDNGIDVYTTINVQHLESRADTVAQITGSVMRETIPDSIFEQADDVEIIDIPPDELIRRLADGKVYTPERSQEALQKFFQVGHLTALREMSLRLTAERVDHQLRDYMQHQRIPGPWKSGQRIIVGISPSPQSVSLIRWARRMAYSMNASWIGVFVESSRKPNPSATSRLEKNLKLARELGAEIVTTADEDVVEALVRVARQENATQILIGKSGYRGMFRRTTILDRLIEKSGDLDVYVVGGERESNRRMHFHIPEISSGTLQYTIAASVILIVSLLVYPFSAVVGYQVVSFVLLFAVSLLPLWFGFGPVLLAAALGALSWDYFFIPPIHTFSIGRTEDVLMLAMYFIVAIITGALSARSRAGERAVRSREARAVALYSLTRDLSGASTQDDVIAAAVTNLKKFFQAEVVIFPGDPDGELPRTPHVSSTMPVSEKEFSVATWVYWNEKKAGKYTDTLPFSDITFFPVSGPRYPLAVIGVRLPGPLGIDQEYLLENFIKQIASTLERELLHEVTTRAVVVEQSEQLYRTLFSSISHELRTPIAAIMGASESLMNSPTASTGGTASGLIADIHTASERLNRLIGNLLNMTRLESGRIRPVRDWCDCNDLIRNSLRETGPAMDARHVTINIAPGLPLLKCDFGLIQQALTNIFHNITEYTPAGSPVEITAASADSTCRITITDHGPGVPPEDLKKIFDKFYRSAGSRTGGTGLGLSIARGFLEAHNGTLTAENADGAGLRCIITLPLEPESPSTPEP